MGGLAVSRNQAFVETEWTESIICKLEQASDAQVQHTNNAHEIIDDRSAYKMAIFTIIKCDDWEPQSPDQVL